MASNGKMYGWVGRILRVDLSSGKIWEIPTSDYVPDFLGGRGVAAKIWWDDGMSPKTSAFDPENRIFFMTGPVTGTPAPTSGRVEVCGKAAQTAPMENFTRSGCGGHWGPELKFAGYDGVVVQGKAPKPVYLWINDGKAEIRDAGHLWGLDTYQTEQLLWQTHGSRTRVMTIGIAGEKLSRIACILTDTGDAAGQGGFGGVMGSKNLKAIAVRGTGNVKVARPEQLLEVTRYAHRLFSRPVSKADPFKPNEPGFIYDRWAYGNGLGVSTIYPGELDTLMKEPGSGYSRRADGCYACPIACRAHQKGPDIIPGVALCVQAVWYMSKSAAYEPEKGYSKVTWEATKLADLYGLNAYDLMGLMEWLERCFQADVLTEADTGLPLSKIGSREFARQFLSIIAERKGFGDVLAEGAYRAAHKVGGQAIKLYEEGYPRGGKFGGYKDHWIWLGGFPTGDALPENILMWCFDSRCMTTSHDFITMLWGALKGTYAGPAARVTSELINSLRAAAKYAYGSEKAVEFYTPDFKAVNWEYKAQAAKVYSTRGALKDSYIVCDVAFPYTYNPNTSDHVGDTSIESKLVSAITGIDISEQDSYKIGERIYTLERAIMATEGRTRQDDVLHDTLYNTPDLGGRLAKREDVEKAKDEFYGLWGFDVATGLPTRKTLEDRGLKAVADGMAKLGVLPK